MLIKKNRIRLNDEGSIPPSDPLVCQTIVLTNCKKRAKFVKTQTTEAKPISIATQLIGVGLRRQPNYCISKQAKLVWNFEGLVVHIGWFSIWIGCCWPWWRAEMWRSRSVCKLSPSSFLSLFFFCKPTKTHRLPFKQSSAVDSCENISDC